MNNILFALLINGIIFVFWLVLFIKDKEKGIQALHVGWETISSMIPMIIILIGAIGIFSSFMDAKNVSIYFGEKSGIQGFLFVSIISSFLQIPGILAFPIAQTLYHNGVAVATVALFACASTMASLFTLPIEMKYLGKKFPFVRIGLTYAISIAVGLLTGIIYHLL
jgi:uncharacterized membrane protein YraQ (UPF0718 family)